jgi:hypothetical protein
MLEMSFRDGLLGWFIREKKNDETTTYAVKFSSEEVLTMIGWLRNPTFQKEPLEFFHASSTSPKSIKLGTLVGKQTKKEEIYIFIVIGEKPNQTKYTFILSKPLAYALSFWLQTEFDKAELPAYQPAGREEEEEEPEIVEEEEEVSEEEVDLDL